MGTSMRNAEGEGRAIMKSHLGVILAATIFFTGCAGIEVERNVTDNVFHSSHPKLNIKIDPQFEYLGKSSDKSFVRTRAGSTDLFADKEAYIFIVPEGEKIKKFLLIHVFQVETQFVNTYFRNVKRKLEEGTHEFGGKEYQYFTKFFSYPSTKYHAYEYIKEKDYVFACGLIRVYARLQHRNIATSIVYYEDVVRDFGLTCQSWAAKAWHYKGKYKDLLNEEQIEYLQQFNDRAMSSFEIVTTEK